ncbi:hypothetical protein D3C84_986480 [compost metagenome]
MQLPHDRFETDMFFMLRVRPVAAPYQALGAKAVFQQRQRGTGEFKILRRRCAQSIDAGHLHPQVPALPQRHQLGKARLIEAQTRIRATEVIDHQRDAKWRQLINQPR